jgi:RNA polymerase sigma factor for flagellar operon FliA
VSAIPTSQVGRSIPTTGAGLLRDRLFVEYKANPTTELRNRIAGLHAGLVHNIATKLHSKLPHSVDVADLEQEGNIALLSCIDRFDPAKGIKFTTFAQFRIRGAILDSLRDLDWVPRLARKRGVEAPKMTSIDRSWARDDYSGQDTLLVDILADENSDPEKPIDDLDQFESLIRCVPVYFRVELRLRYIDGLTQKQISDRLGKSESRINQKLKAAISILKSQHQTV